MIRVRFSRDVVDENMDRTGQKINANAISYKKEEESVETMRRRNIHVDVYFCEHNGE